MFRTWVRRSVLQRVAFEGGTPRRATCQAGGGVAGPSLSRAGLLVRPWACMHAKRWSGRSQARAFIAPPERV